MSGTQVSSSRRLRTAGRLVVAQSCVYHVIALLALLVGQERPSLGSLFADTGYPISVVLLVFDLAILLWCITLVPMPGADRHVPVLPGAQILTVSLVLMFFGLPSPSASSFSWLHASSVVIVLYPFRMAMPLVWTFGLAHLAGAALAGGTVALVAMGLPLLSGLSLVVGMLIDDHVTQSEMLDQARWAASEYAKVNERLSDKITFTELSARSQERLRLARQIHDTIGYTLTGVLLQLSAVRGQIRNSPVLAEKRVDALQDAMRAALNDVRAEVSSIREDAEEIESWKTQWENVCRNFSLATAVRIHVNIHQHIPQLADQVGADVYHILQEALTNAYRHGRAKFIDVSVGMYASRLLVRVSDDGMGATQVKMGNGLKGIRERVDALGGEVVFQTDAHRGFDIGISIPFSGRPA